MKYKYLLWDIDQTILNFSAAENASIKALFKQYNLGICTDEMVDVYSKINDKYWQALERGEMTKPEILVGRFVEFFKTYGIDTSIATCFNDAYQQILGDTIVFRDNSYEILKELSSEYVLCAITNGTLEAQTKKLENSGLNKIFGEKVFISDQIGIEKPNIGFFNAVFSKLNIKDKSQVLVIGDSLTSDIRGAINAGVDSVWYNPFGKNINDSGATYMIWHLSQIFDILNNDFEEKQCNTNQVYSGSLLKVFKDGILLPNGQPSNREYIKHNGAVCIVALTDDNRVVVEKQFRYPLRSIITELPAGKLDSANEDHLSAAKRELKEETGFEAEKWTYLGSLYPSVAYTTEEIFVYLAQNLKSGKRNLDEDEFLSYSLIPLEKLKNLAMNDMIKDSKSLFAILKVCNLLGV